MCIRDRFLFGSFARIHFLTLLVSLPFFHPCFKQLDYGFLHSLRCVGAWEELSDFLHRQFQIPIFRFLLLSHYAENRIVIQFALLRKSPHTLCLGEGWRCLFAVDGFNQNLLLIGLEIGNLDCGGHSDFALIDQVL